MSHDAELEELVKRFQTLQRDEVPSHISERNVVEIVNVLIKRHLVELLYTTDAKEYLTWDELKKEIVDEVWANEGRLNVVDLPGLLSVHTHQVERVLPDILSDDPSLRVENGELMTDTYLDRTVQSLEDALKEQGFLSVAQFASANRFSSDFAKKVIEEGLAEGRIAAVMEESILYTKEFVSVQKRMLRACLLAQHQPADVKELMKRNALFLPLAAALIELVAAEVPGTFSGDVYIPTVFEAYRTSQIENIYKSNGFVEYAALQSLGLSNPREYMRSRFNEPASSAVDDAAMAPSNTTTSSGAGKRGRRKGGGGKPSASKEANARGSEVVRATAEYPLCGYALSACFLSDRLLNNVLALQSISDKEVLALDITAHLPTQIDVAEDWSTIEPRLRELFPGLATCELIEGTVLVRHDAKDTVRAAIKEALVQAPGTNAAKSRKAASPAAARDPAAIARTAIAASLSLPEGVYDTVLDALTDDWSGMIEQLVEEHQAADALGAAARLRQSRMTLQATMAARWIDLSLAAKGVQWAANQLDANTHAVLCRHLLSTFGFEMVRDVLTNESLDRPELQRAVSDALAPVTSANQLARVVKVFPIQAQADLTTLVNAVNGKAVDPFMTVLQDLGSSGAIAVSSFHQVNKKTERDAYARLRDVSRQQAEKGVFTSDEVSSGELFASICTLLIHVLFHVHLVVPGKAVGAVVERLCKETVAPAAQLEQSLHLVTTALQSHTPLTPESIDSLEALRVASLEVA